VVWSKGTRLAELPDLAPDAIRRIAPHLTVTAITPFGLEGPWRDRPATEFTLQAWSGGIVGLGRGASDLPPVFVGGQIGEWLTGLYAAVGTMASRARAERDGPGELVDVAMLETLALCLTYFPVSFADMVGRPFRSGRALITPGVESASDGLVGLGVGTGQQWLDFCAMVGHPEWTEDRKLFVKRTHLAPEVAAWMADRTREEILELAGLFRIPHAPIGNGATIPVTDHFEARHAMRTNPRTDAIEPGPPYRFDPPLLRDPGPAPRPGEHETSRELRDAPSGEGGHASLPFAGLRILDLTAFWAGPLCTHVLGMLGAEVLHIESTARPDGTRMLAGVRFSEPDWWEQSGIFSGLNTNKKSVTLDLGSDRGKELLGELLATCDVVVENYTPRVLEQLGFDVSTGRQKCNEKINYKRPLVNL
jgi:crotonobetainyl-CoA:carnitine CoA-transferase CaiB-like acyl-CoA transferase